MAQVWNSPAAIATASTMPCTAWGVATGAVELSLSPSWPKRFDPQHTTAPRTRSAHECSVPVTIATGSVSGTSLKPKSCSKPSCNLSLLPHPRFVASAEDPTAKAVVCAAPAATLNVAPAGPRRGVNMTWSGTPGKRVTCPAKLWPQQETTPEWAKAHV
jgi:hypothetical protein